MQIPNRTFKLFSLIGYPLAHTLSPPMHMAAFKKLGIHGLYVPFEIDPPQFARMVKDLKRLPFHGFNVTVPYKEQILAAVQTLSDEARIMGAVNTVKRGARLKGFNTDAYG